MSESTERANLRTSDPAQSAADLSARLLSIEERIAGAVSGAKPWWRRFEVSGPIAATLITAMVSVTTVAVQQIAKNRELELAAIKQQAAINQDYLSNALEVHDDPSKREFALDFYSQVLADKTVRAWALNQLNVMRANHAAAEAKQAEEQLKQSYQKASPEGKAELEERLRSAEKEAVTLEVRARSARRIATINNLAAPDTESRLQAAQDLVTVWRRDPHLPEELLRFVQEHPGDPRAIYNAVVVVDGLVACCAGELEEHKEAARRTSDLELGLDPSPRVSRRISGTRRSPRARCL